MADPKCFRCFFVFPALFEADGQIVKTRFMLAVQHHEIAVHGCGVIVLLQLEIDLTEAG